jgi:hypothetical protein
MNRKVWITCAVLSVVACLCLGVAATIGASLFTKEAGPLSDILEIDEFPFLPQETPESRDSEATPLEDPEVQVELNPEIIAEMEFIQQQVIRDRGLEPSGVFTRTLLTRDQLRQRVIDDFLEDYSPEEAREDVIILESLGLLNADFDMYQFYLDLLSEQVAGFYDNETKEMVVVQGSTFAGTERLTYAHEYTHALQDQNYDLRDGLDYSEESCENDSERCAAIQSLIEGDASLSELNWFMNHANSEDRLDILDFYNSFEQPVMDSSPDFISEDFLFPYEYGFAFVQYLYDRGGWEAVDQVYANLPLSTEQILHPEQYPADKPIPITLPDLVEVLGEGWMEIDQDVMGEWYTYLILAYGLDEDARLDEDEAAEAAEGWGGDAFSVLYHEETSATVMVLRTLWESSVEAVEFADAFQAYARDRFTRPKEFQPDYVMWVGDEEVHTLHIESVYTTWILAPDEITADLVWNAVSDK